MSIYLADPVEWDHPLNRGLAAWPFLLPGRTGSLTDLTGRGIRGTIGTGVKVRPAPNGHLGLGFINDDLSIVTFPRAPVASGTTTNAITIAWWWRLDLFPAANWPDALEPIIWRADTDFLSAHYDYLGTAYNNTVTDGTRYTFTHTSAGSSQDWVRICIYSEPGANWTYYENGVAAHSASLSSIDVGSSWALGTRVGATQSSVGTISDIRVSSGPKLMPSAEFARLDYQEARRGYPGLLRRVRRRAMIGFGGSVPFWAYARNQSRVLGSGVH
jgi:hypothetical protein